MAVVARYHLHRLTFIFPRRIRLSEFLNLFASGMVNDIFCFIDVLFIVLTGDILVGGLFMLLVPVVFFRDGVHADRAHHKLPRRVA